MIVIKPKRDLQNTYIIGVKQTQPVILNHGLKAVSLGYF